MLVSCLATLLLCSFLIEVANADDDESFHVTTPGFKPTSPKSSASSPSPPGGPEDHDDDPQASGDDSASEANVAEMQFEPEMIILGH